MSKPVRIREFVATQVEVVAESEHRSFANAVEVLLLAALEERGSPSRGRDLPVEDEVETGHGAERPLATVAASRSSSAAAVPPKVHDVPVDPAPRSWSLPSERAVAAGLALRDGKCTADVARGTKCKLCGKVH